MYAVYDGKNLIALHDDRLVAQKYIQSVYSCHKINLDLKKIKKSSIDKSEIYDSLYLVRYADTYVQSGYIQYIDYANSQFIEDDMKARDILIRVLEYADISEKERKKLKKAIAVLEDVVSDDREYTPSFDELRNLKMHYDPYLYNAGLL